MNSLRPAGQLLIACVLTFSAAVSTNARPRPQSIDQTGPRLLLNIDVRREYKSLPQEAGLTRGFETFALTVTNAGSATYVSSEDKSLWKISVYPRGGDPSSPTWSATSSIQCKTLLHRDWCYADEAVWEFDPPQETQPYTAEVEFVPTGAKQKKGFEISPPPVASILFTGKLMGYFRLPDRQSITFVPVERTNVPFCSPQRSDASVPTVSTQPSADASVFIKAYRDRSPETLLLSTGDNFSPNYYSRVLTDVPVSTSAFPQKELYDWNGQNWQFYADPKNNTGPDQRKGLGTIPTDNVACFMSYVHYDAIVPGKEDFYYGPERLRELARLLATPHGSDDPFQSVQMLGSNLVIKTTWIPTWHADHAPIPDITKPPLGFISKYISQDNAHSLEIEDFTDGGYVYPWLQFVRITAKGWPNAFDRIRVYLCEAKDGDPDDLIENGKTTCKYPQSSPLSLNQAATEQAQRDRSSQPRGQNEFNLVYRLPNPEVDGDPKKYFGVLKPGKNYAICIPDPDEPTEGGSSKHPAKPYCFRFAVFAPFFQYPDAPSIRDGTGNDKYADPQLYVLKKVHATEAVVFGVVDPDLGQHVGGDNFAWKNVRGVDSDKREKKFNTEIAVANPVTALIQLEDYFEMRYPKDHQGQNFRGVRVLLAQMPPEEAKELAEHLPKCLRFDVIITAADDGLATPNQSVAFQPSPLPGNVDGTCPTNVGASGLSLKSTDFLNGSFASPPTFIAVPPTHEKQPPGKTKRLLQARRLDLQSEAPTSWTYSLSEAPIPVRIPGSQNAPDADKLFWLGVCHRLYPVDKEKHCQLQSSESNSTEQFVESTSKIPARQGDWLPWNDTRGGPNEVGIEQLTLSVIREKWHADVAMLQQRDFYLGALDEYISDYCAGQAVNSSDSTKCDPSLAVNLQELLDRIIWKGDFIRVISVQGSVLKNVLKQSTQYAAAEKTAYLPVSEVGRPLVTLGLKSDSSAAGYLINGKPLDPAALYTVATSDYIALGDTGYADLATPPVGNPPHPTTAPEGLVSISGAVCQEIKEDTIWGNAVCSPGLERESYYDELADRTPDDSRPGNTSWHQFYSWSFLHPRFGQATSKGVPSPPSPSDIGTQAQNLVDSIENWDINLSKFAVGFSTLSHNLSEETLSQQFGGVQNAQVNAKHFHSWDWDADSKFTRYGPKTDWFLSEGLQYSSNFISQTTGPRSETQSRNLFAIDGGVYLHPLKLWGDAKKLPQLSAVLSGHFETQVGNPITSIKLNPIPPSTSATTLNFFQGRTNLALGRTGLRWQNVKSYVEGGLEGGKTLNAIQQFNITSTSGAIVPCLLEASVSLTTCLNNYNKAHPLAPVTSSSIVTAVRHPQDRYGAYWTMGLTIPINPKVAYNFQETSDYFFLSAGDNSADTRFRHQLVNTFQFYVFPNLTFNPTYSIFLYQNKIDYHFLFQQQLMVQINYTFDWSNTHEWRKDLAYKKPLPQ